VEYVFVGFPSKLSQKQKKKIIKRHGKPRKYKPSLIDTKNATIDFGPTSWMTQIIYRKEGKD